MQIQLKCCYAAHVLFNALFCAMRRGSERGWVSGKLLEQSRTIAIKIWFSSIRLDQSMRNAWSKLDNGRLGTLAAFSMHCLFSSEKSINVDHVNDWFPVRNETKILAFKKKREEKKISGDYKCVKKKVFVQYGIVSSL